MFYRVAAVNEDRRPLVGVTVEAIDLLNYPTVLATAETDRAGQATFTVAGPVFFRPRVRRTSATVGERVFTGQVEIQVVSFGSYMNADYVVDSNGFGTHTAYFSASGALKAAIDSGANKYIWICSTHSETTTAVTLLGSPTAGQHITTASGGSRAVINCNVPGGTVFKLNGAGGVPVVLEFQNITFNSTSASAMDFFHPSSVTANSAVLMMKDCRFYGSNWQYLYTGHTVDGNAATVGGLHIDGGEYNLTSFLTTDNSSNDAGIYASGDSGNLTGRFTVKNSSGVIGAFNTAFGAASADGARWWTITANNYKCTSGGVNIGTSLGGLNGSLLFSGNSINHTANGDFISIRNNCQNITVVANAYQANGSAGASTVFFHNNAGTPLNVIVMGNELFGPGSGTAISVQGSTSASAVFGPNTYRGWTTNIAGTGSASVITEPMRFSSLSIDSTVTTAIQVGFYRSGVLKAYFGIWRQDALQSPFAANDFTFGTYDGSFHDVMGFAVGGAQMKVATSELITGYLYVGATAGTAALWTVPANTTAGDLTATRLNVGNVAFPVGVEVYFSGDTLATGYMRVGSGTAPTDTAAGSLTVNILNVIDASGFSLSQGASLATIAFDTGDALVYNQTANRFRFQIANIQYGAIEAVGNAAYWYAGTPNSTAKRGVLYASGDHTDPGIIILESHNGTDQYKRIDAYGNQLRFMDIIGTEFAYIGPTWMRTVGYARVGSLTAPANTTAGDLTIGRLNISNTAFTNASQVIYVDGGSITPAASFNLLDFRMTLTANGGNVNNNLLAFTINNNPTAADSGAVDGIVIGMTHGGGAFAQTGFVIGLDVQNTFNRTGGSIGSLFGYRSLWTMSAGTVSNGYGFQSRWSSFGGGTMTAFSHFHARATPTVSGTMGTIVGLSIDNLGAANVTNAIAIDITAQSGASTLNFDIRSAGNSVFGGYLRVGGTTAPANTTAGDFTATRAVLGTDAAMPASTSIYLNAATRVNGNIGFFNTAPQSQQTSGANLTNNVTAGGTSDQVDDFTDLLVYANDAATIRNDIYQLGRKLKQVNDALRVYGLLT